MSSHELKNPLTSLRSAVETLQYARPTSSARGSTASSRTMCRRLDRLITDIADASRLDAELARAKAKPVDLSSSCACVVDLARRDQEGQRAPYPLELVDAAASRAFTVLGHDNRLGQVVRNLVDNAASFSPPARPSRCGSAPAAPGRVPGRRRGARHRPEQIDAHLRALLYRSPAASYFGKNSGLGLSISRQIVEAHGGKITAANRHGTATGSDPPPVLGARFTVRLPAVEGGRDVMTEG